jgi:salicylate hydroxylase
MISAASLAVEDANALGTLFSHIPSSSTLPSILAGFQDIRQPATDRACMTELAYFDMLQLPPGAERDARDVEMRAIRDRDREPDEEEMRKNWERLGFIYSHDASDAAEDWWVKWGRLGAQTGDQAIKDEG